MLSETTTDPADRLISSQAYSYDPAGNVLTTTDGVGNVVANTYDAAEQLVSEITRDAAGKVVASQSYSYDLDGEVTQSTDGDGNVTIEVYDADGQVLSEATTDPQSRVISSASAAFDPNGNVLTSTDGDGNIPNQHLQRPGPGAHFDCHRRQRCGHHLVDVHLHRPDRSGSDNHRPGPATSRSTPTTAAG